VCFTPDGAYLFACHDDGFVFQWDVITGRQVRSVRRGFQRVCLTCSPDGRRVFLGCPGQIVYTAEVNQTMLPFSPLLSCEGATVLAHSPTQPYLACGTEKVQYGACIQIWDVDSRTLVTKLYGHNAPVVCLAWSPDGRYIVSA
ncbi:WD40 repeat-like protein, partial [Auricularia subglabra TFB-10046 SS5]